MLERKIEHIWQIELSPDTGSTHSGGAFFFASDHVLSCGARLAGRHVFDHSSQLWRETMDDIFSHIDALFDEARNKEQAVKSIRICSDLKQDFVSRAGAAYVDGHYFGIPVTFDLNDPTLVAVVTGPSD